MEIEENKLHSLLLKLKDKGMNFNATNEYNENVIQNMTFSRNFNVLNALIKLGCDPLTTTKHGQSLFHQMFSNYRDLNIKAEKCFDLLLEVGLDPFLENEYGKNCFDYISDIDEKKNFKNKAEKFNLLKSLELI